MNPRVLKNNEDLFRYLIQVGEKLEKQRLSELAEIVIQASRFASGSSSEFMHEAQLALERVKKERPSDLSSSELQDMDAVIIQIKEAFHKIGDA